MDSLSEAQGGNGMVISHNISALNTVNQMSRNEKAVQSSLKKLSSGLRINSAADDAAGLAISQKMRAQINGLDQSSRNAQDGISLIQTAEGALSETQSILQRMGTLAEQAANGSQTDADRSKIQVEIDQLTQEITHISNDTQFNGKTLLDGSLTDAGTGSLRLQIGANRGQTLNLSIGAMDAATLGVAGTAASGGGGTTTSATTATGTITGGDDIASVTFSGSPGSGVTDGETLAFQFTPAVTASYSYIQSSYAINRTTSQAAASTGTDDITVSVDGSNYILTGDQLKIAWGNASTTGTCTNHSYTDLEALLDSATDAATGKTLSQVADVDLWFRPTITSKTADSTPVTITALGSSQALFGFDYPAYGPTQGYIGSYTGSAPNPTELTIGSLTANGSTSSTTAEYYADIDFYVSGADDVNITVGTDTFTLAANDVTFDPGTQDINDLSALLGTAQDSQGNLLSKYADITASGGKLTITSKNAAGLITVNTRSQSTMLFGFNGPTHDIETPGTSDTLSGTQTVSIDATANSYTFTSGDYAGTTITMKPGKKLADLSPFTNERATVSKTTTTSVSASGTTGAAQFSGGIDVSSQPAAESAITTIHDAIDTVSTQRAQLGAYQNVLGHIINNLSTESQNLTSSASIITDVDMAKEMVQLTKNNILMQASQAMLAQANLLPQGVLQLLKA